MRLTRLFALAAIVTLHACALPAVSVPSTPAESANATTLDERGALAFEVAYRAAGAVLEHAVDSGRLRGTDAARANEIDARAYAAVKAARAAYDARNAGTYIEAVEQSWDLIAQLRAAVGSASQ